MEEGGAAGRVLRVRWSAGEAGSSAGAGLVGRTAGVPGRTAAVGPALRVAGSGPSLAWARQSESRRGLCEARRQREEGES